MTSLLIALFPFVTFLLLSYSISEVLRRIGFQILTVFLIVNVKIFNCFIHYVCFYSHEKCQIKVLKCIFNDTVTLQQVIYYLNIYGTFNLYK